MSQTVNKIDVKYVAGLARIKLTKEEALSFQREINDIVHYVRLLNEVNVENIEPTAHAMPVVNVLRNDEPKPLLNHDWVLANAPAVTKDDGISVPAILQTDEEGA
ncbi:MAG: Asp-tRNA(Asn)/Glu-tRNA(Gln) amidotransferase subunit GatC [Planctomycetota bacterium]